MKHLLFVTTVLLLAPLHATEFHVASAGDDNHAGTAAAPLRTIQRAATLAQPGDTITVHAGIYRERIDPPRGGESEAKRITYQAAAGAKVEIRGSEVVKGWQKAGDNLWKVVVPNAFFGDFNPYADRIKGDWFSELGRPHHTGAVYVNGDWLIEAATLEAVKHPAGESALWFGEVDAQNTTLWAQLKGVDPNAEGIEINVRQAVFYPSKPGVNFITVRGFALRHAATPWAPPTAEQIGLIGTHWSKGWIIEDNIVSHSRCTGITLGKHGDAFDNTSANSAEGYVKTVERAVAQGWNKQTIGHHVVRNNIISHCEQAGLVGSLGAVFSSIRGNTIHDIHVQRLFSGAEMAGIKIHAPIDTEIRGNHIYQTCRGIWLDWMTQGTRVTANLLHDNAREDLFVEVNHGPFLVDNNIMLSATSVTNQSQGAAYVHNLMAGKFNQLRHDQRLTPYHKAHSTEVVKLHDNPSGDDRFYHNVLVERIDLSGYDKAPLPSQMAGNVFLKGAKPSKLESAPLVQADFDPALKLLEKSGNWYLEMKMDPAWSSAVNRPLVTTELLGKAHIPDCAFENPDATPLRIDSDYFGKLRGDGPLAPGPFARPGPAGAAIKVW